MMFYVRIEKSKKLPNGSTSYRKDGIWVKLKDGYWKKYHSFHRRESWPGYEKIPTIGTGSVEIHPLHGSSERDINIAVAKFLSSFGYHVKLLPIVDTLVNGKGKSQYINGIKSADFYVNGDGPMGGKVWELESIERGKNSKAVRDSILKGAKQWKNVMIHPHDQIPEAEIITGLKRLVGSDKRHSVKEIALYYRDTLLVFEAHNVPSIEKKTKQL